MILGAMSQLMPACAEHSGEVPLAGVKAHHSGVSPSLGKYLSFFVFQCLTFMVAHKQCKNFPSVSSVTHWDKRGGTKSTNKQMQHLNKHSRMPKKTSNTVNYQSQH